MAIARESVAPPLTRGLEVASPYAHHGTHDFRSASNFNRIVDGIIRVASDHAGDIGNISFIKEWWEDPAIVGETEDFPCFYVIPLHPDVTKVTKESPYQSDPYIGDPLSKTTFPVTIMGYYKYTDVRQPLRDVRNYAWNFWDILSSEKKDYVLPGGLQTMIPNVGWHISGTNYVVQWWSMRLKFTGIL